MRSYARNQGAQISNAMLKADMKANDVDSLDEDTVMSYVNALKKIFVIEDMSAWCRYIESIREKIDTGRMKAPAFLMILTAVGDYAYRREDGIYVMPVGCLRD